MFACRLSIARNCDLKNRCHRCGDAIGNTNRRTTAISTYKNVAMIVQTKLIFDFFFDLVSFLREEEIREEKTQC